LNVVLQDVHFIFSLPPVTHDDVVRWRERRDHRRPLDTDYSIEDSMRLATEAYELEAHQESQGTQDESETEVVHAPERIPPVHHGAFTFEFDQSDEEVFTLRLPEAEDASPAITFATNDTSNEASVVARFSEEAADDADDDDDDDDEMECESPSLLDPLFARKLHRKLKAEIRKRNKQYTNL
jgi:hypothetical protein